MPCTVTRRSSRVESTSGGAGTADDALTSATRTAAAAARYLRISAPDCRTAALPRSPRRPQAGRNDPTTSTNHSLVVRCAYPRANEAKTSPRKRKGTRGHVTSSHLFGVRRFRARDDQREPRDIRGTGGRESPIPLIALAHRHDGERRVVARSVCAEMQ